MVVSILCESVSTWSFSPSFFVALASIKTHTLPTMQNINDKGNEYSSDHGAS